VAIRWIAPDGSRRDFTYADLRAETNRFANVLRTLGVGRGDVVAVLAGRVPELYVAALGTLKNGSVFTPLFSAFGPEPIQSRLNIARAKALVTTDVLCRRKVEALRASLPSLEHVLIVGEPAAVRLLRATRDFRSLVASADSHFTIPATDPEDGALLHFTSGTTGKPKGAVTSTRRWSPIMPPAASLSISTPTTCSGAQRTRVGSPARPTASSRRSRMG
jgi:acetyl-CoA synthetase